MWSRAVTSGRQRVDKQGAVPDINNSHFMLDQPWRREQQYWRYLANALASSPWTDSTRKSFRTSSGTTPCVSTLCLPDITACGQISQAFLPCICILQVNKCWRWERSGKPPSASHVCLRNAVPQQEELHACKWQGFAGATSLWLVINQRLLLRCHPLPCTLHIIPYTAEVSLLSHHLTFTGQGPGNVLELKGSLHLPWE